MEEPNSNICEFERYHSALANKKVPNIRQIGILYSVTVVLFLIVGFRVQRREFYSGILITEFLLVAAPAIIFLWYKRYNLKYVLRLNKISAANLATIFGIMLFSLPLVGLFNAVNLMLVKLVFGKTQIAQPPVATNLGELLVNVLVIGASAGICEEILFRGAIQRGFEKLGVKKAILLTAFLFSLMHMDFQKSFGTFLLGALIGFIVYRSNSIFGGMFAHFTNNSIAVLLAFALNKLQEIIRASGLGDLNQNGSLESSIDSITKMSIIQLIGAIFVWGSIIVFSAVVFVILLKVFIRNTSQMFEPVKGKEARNGAGWLVWMLPGLVLVCFIYVIRGFSLLGIHIGVLDSLFKLITG